jgi:Ca2+-dependent lipid-binding protein
LIVHECRGLPQRINTFASIAVNGIDKMNTSTVKRTGNPKYEESYEMVVLDKTSLLMRIEIKNASKDGDVLGRFSAYAVDILRQQSKNGGWWDLLDDNDECIGQARIHIEWKPTIMTGLSDLAGGFKFDCKYIYVI